MLTGVVARVRPPSSLVVLSEGWPAFLVPVLALGMHLAAAFFPVRLHRYFKSRGSLTWQSPSDYVAYEPPQGAIFLVSGSVEFLRRIWSFIPDPDRVLLVVDLKRRGASRARLAASQRDAEALVSSELGLYMRLWRDSDLGGTTDATYTFGFGGFVRGSATLEIDGGLPLSIGHFVDGKVRGINGPVPVPSGNPLCGEGVRRVHWFPKCSRVSPRGTLPS